MKKPANVKTFLVENVRGFGPGLFKKFTLDLAKGGWWEGPAGQAAAFGTDETPERPVRTLQAWFPGSSVSVEQGGLVTLHEYKAPVKNVFQDDILPDLPPVEVVRIGRVEATKTEKASKGLSVSQYVERMEALEDEA